MTSPRAARDALHSGGRPIPGPSKWNADQVIDPALLLTFDKWTVGYLLGRYVSVENHGVYVAIEFTGPHGWGTGSAYLITLVRKTRKFYVDKHSWSPVWIRQPRAQRLGPFPTIEAALVQYDLATGL